MCESESITYMLIRFTDIIDSLKSLIKIYINAELLRKVFRHLPKSKNAKVIDIQEVKDLNKLSLDEIF